MRHCDIQIGVSFVKSRCCLSVDVRLLSGAEEPDMAVRAERVPAEEIRQRMLDAGRELALEAGAALTIEHLRLEEVIQRARVPRSSVYRMWAYREDYTEDLLCYLAGPGSSFADRTVFDPETVTVIGRALQENMRL